MGMRGQRQVQIRCLEGELQKHVTPCCQHPCRPALPSSCQLWLAGSSVEGLCQGLTLWLLLLLPVSRVVGCGRVATALVPPGRRLLPPSLPACFPKLPCETQGTSSLVGVSTSCPLSICHCSFASWHGSASGLPPRLGQSPHALSRPLQSVTSLP